MLEPQIDLPQVPTLFGLHVVQGSIKAVPFGDVLNSQGDDCSGSGVPVYALGERTSALTDLRHREPMVPVLRTADFRLYGGRSAQRLLGVSERDFAWPGPPAATAAKP